MVLARRVLAVAIERTVKPLDCRLVLRVAASPGEPLPFKIRRLIVALSGSVALGVGLGDGSELINVLC